MKHKSNLFTPAKWDDDVPLKGYELKENVSSKVKHNTSKNDYVTNTKPSPEKKAASSDDKNASEEISKRISTGKIKNKKFNKTTNKQARKLESKIQADDQKSNLTLHKINSDTSEVLNGRLNKSKKMEKEKPHTKSVLHNISQQSSTINSNLLNISKRKRRQINKLKKLQLNEGKSENVCGNTEITEVKNKSQIGSKLNKLKYLLKKSDNSKIQDQTGSELLRDKLLDKLKGSRFRYLNEQMYTTRGSEALKMFQDDPDSFIAYHEGYRHQVQKWPLNPLDTIIQDIKKMPVTYEIADFGCGDARLSKSVPHKVHSFDLVSLTDEVTACDMANVPLKTSSVDVAVYCLSLMGVNIKDYLLEANRVLKMGGTLKISEVSSRFTDAHGFIKDVAKYGFKVMNKNFSNEMFYFINFKKIGSPNKSNLPKINLKSCLYKKR